jgi:hypothetical protein
MNIEEYGCLGERNEKLIGEELKGVLLIDI